MKPHDGISRSKNHKTLITFVDFCMFISFSRFCMFILKKSHIIEWICNSIGM